MHGGVMTYRVVSLGPNPHEGGPIPTAQEVNAFLAKAAYEKVAAEFMAISLDDPNPTPTQHKFTVRLNTVDYKDDVFYVTDQLDHFFPIDAPETISKTSVEFDVIT